MMRVPRVLAMGAVVGWVAIAASGAAGAPATHTITMDGTVFSPETLTVKRGDRVVWVNKDPFPHTATAASKAFDSRSVAAGKSWSHVAKQSGTFDYVCTFHPTMKGRLIVQ